MSKQKKQRSIGDFFSRKRKADDDDEENNDNIGASHRSKYELELLFGREKNRNDVGFSVVFSV